MSEGRKGGIKYGRVGEEHKGRQTGRRREGCGSSASRYCCWVKTIASKYSPENTEWPEHSVPTGHKGQLCVNASENSRVQVTSWRLNVCHRKDKGSVGLTMCLIEAYQAEHIRPDKDQGHM